MSHIRQFDHLGITVADSTRLGDGVFADLGLEAEDRTVVGGQFIDAVIGIPDLRTEIARWAITGKLSGSEEPPSP